MIPGAAGMVALVASIASPVGPRYGDTLAAAVLARQHLARGIRIEAAARDGGRIVVAAGLPASGARAVLRDAMGRSAGTITLTGRSAADAARAASYISRRLYLAGALAESDPFVPGAVRSRRGQTLVEAMISRFPDLVTLALHVGPPASGRIVASSFGRVGKPNDEDDRRVAGEGAVLQEVTDGGMRVAVELPLLDRSGRTIGALSTSFRVPADASPGASRTRAETVRGALARAIPSETALDEDQR